MSVQQVEHLEGKSIFHLKNVRPYGVPDEVRTLTIPHDPHYLAMLPLFPKEGLQRLVPEFGVVHDGNEEFTVPSVGTIAFIRAQQEFDYSSSSYNANNHDTQGPYLPQALSTEIREYGLQIPVLDAKKPEDWERLEGAVKKSNPWIGWVSVEAFEAYPRPSEEFQVQSLQQSAFLKQMDLTAIVVERFEEERQGHWFGYGPTARLAELLKGNPAAGVMIYSFDRLAKEELVNLRAVRKYFSLPSGSLSHGTRLYSVTEIIDEPESDVFIRNQPALDAAKRIHRVGELKRFFSNPVSFDKQQCPECPSKADGYDVIAGDGSSTYYRTMHVCNGCHSYSVGREQWTTDY